MRVNSRQKRVNQIRASFVKDARRQMRVDTRSLAGANLSSICGCGIIIKHHSLYTAPVMVNLLISLLIGPTFLSYLLIGRYKKGSAKPNQVAKFIVN